MLSAVLRTGDVQAVIDSGLETKMLKSHRDAWKWLLGYWKRRGTTPTRAEFASRFPAVHLVRASDPAGAAEALVQLYVRGKLMNSIQKSLDLIEADDVDSALRTLGSSVRESRIVTSRHERRSLFSADHGLEMYKDLVTRTELSAENGMPGVPTGFSSIDNVTGGLQAGWICGIATRFGVGKTWTLLKCAEEATWAGHNVLFVSLEQSISQIGMRMHSIVAPRFGRKFNNLDLVRGMGVSLDVYRDFMTELASVKGTLDVMDSSKGPVRMDDVAVALARGYDLVIIDYLSLLVGNSGEDGWKQFGDATAEIKGMCSAASIPGMFAAQIGRAGEGKIPPSADKLAESDRIGQHVDLLVTAARPAENVLHFLFAKNRHGPSGQTWFCHYAPWAGIFDEIDGNTASRLMQPPDED